MQTDLINIPGLSAKTITLLMSNGIKKKSDLKRKSWLDVKKIKGIGLLSVARLNPYLKLPWPGRRPMENREVDFCREAINLVNCYSDRISDKRFLLNFAKLRDHFLKDWNPDFWESYSKFCAECGEASLIDDNYFLRCTKCNKAIINEDRARAISKLNRIYDAYESLV